MLLFFLRAKIRHSCNIASIQLSIFLLPDVLEQINFIWRSVIV